MPVLASHIAILAAQQYRIINYMSRRASALISNTHFLLTPRPHMAFGNYLAGLLRRTSYMVIRMVKYLALVL